MSEQPERCPDNYAGLCRAYEIARNEGMALNDPILRKIAQEIALTPERCPKHGDKLMYKGICRGTHATPQVHPEGSQPERCPTLLSAKDVAMKLANVGSGFTINGVLWSTR